jgi:hypothetical protein
MNVSALEKGVQMYHAPKADNELDLVDAVRQSLINAGLKDRVDLFFDNNKFIQEATGKNADVQRFLLNRYWTTQLMNAPVQSMDQRIALVPNGDVRDWLVLFRERVLPFVVEQNLPIAI